LAEIEFWRDKAASLSTLHEQLNLPIVHTMLNVLRKAAVIGTSSGNTNSLEIQLGELNKFYIEAKDNIKFLSTLERHLKHIIVGSLSSVQVKQSI
jgi:dynein heavy chain